MPLIECKAGPSTNYVYGRTYEFERDRFGRFVANVDDISARAIFLAVEHFREVPDVPVEETPAEAAADASAEKPKAPKAPKAPKVPKEQAPADTPPVAGAAQEVTVTEAPAQPATETPADPSGA